ncbi:Endonuclease/exonuclease/phosphatase, partial [Cubamyces menziesii]
GRDETGGGRRTHNNAAKAHLKIATLNMKGWGPQDTGRPSEKWMRINQIMRDKKIAILAVQETHLDEMRARTLADLFDKHMSIEYSSDPENETAARGVAFVINKRIIKKPPLAARTLIPGRAMIIDIAWSDSRNLRILNVYAPNASRENATLWKTMEEMDLGRIDIMLGDFNVVEDPLDRLPARADPADATEALQSLTRKLRLADGWRRTHDGQLAFTYQHTNGTTQSRLDRIYAARMIRKDADNWGLEEAGIQTDHKVAYVEIADREAPFVGKGRWTMPLHLLKDETMQQKMLELANRLITDMDAISERTEAVNPQLIYKAFKDDLVKAARERAKVKVPQMQRRIEKLRIDRDKILVEIKDRRKQNRTESLEEDVKALERRAAILQERITKLEEKRFETARKRVADKHKLSAETMTKAWIRPNYTP